MKNSFQKMKMKMKEKKSVNVSTMETIEADDNEEVK